MLAENEIVKSVWTTNFDGLMLKTAHSYGLVPIEVTLESQDRIFRNDTDKELLCIALHGDYKYGPLKNTETELDNQSEVLVRALTHEIEKRNFIVLGYSGRDNSVMDALERAYMEKGAGRIYWCGYGRDIPPKVQRFLEKINQSGRNAFYVPTDGFDKTMLNIAHMFFENEDLQRRIEEIKKNLGVRCFASYANCLLDNEFNTQVKDIINVGLARYRDKYAHGKVEQTPFVLYEKYSRRDVSLLMNCGKDMSSTMYGMSRIGDDVFIFITYHKEEAEEGKNYADGKPDYADAFEDNLIFKWDSQIGKDNSSPYMQKVLTAPRKHLLVKKSDAESSFYYMGQFDIIESVDSQKEDNSGKMKPIAKVTMKMHHPVREDLLRYLQSNISKENKAV